MNYVGVALSLIHMSRFVSHSASVSPILIVQQMHTPFFKCHAKF